MRRDHRSARVVVCALGGTLVVTACGDDDVAIASQDSTLTQLVATTTTSPATTAPPETTIEATTTTVYVAPVPGCLDYMDFQIQAGQEDAVDLWQDELGESREQLQAYCEDLAESNPRRVQEMIEEKRVIDAFLEEVAANEAATQTTEG